MEQKNNSLLKLAESIVSQVDKETLAEIAKSKLNEAMNSYEVKDAIVREMYEPIKEEAKRLLLTEEIKQEIKKETLKRVSTILGPVVDEVLRKVVNVIVTK